ncbi:MAG: hypothetical protein DRN04_04530 [Thermoprotei archaeon]|nr:MAG: hypothetical protein DRN04_04530 [Thermoprotei archaeon]
MIALDTDVLAVYFIFKWDKRYKTAAKLIESDLVKATTIVNVLELTGLMAIAQGATKARQLFTLLHRRRDFEILYWKEWPSLSNYIMKSLNYIYRKMSFGDAQVAWILEEQGVNTLVTWNKKHFMNKGSFEVLTPEEYLLGTIFS